jgi:hypothetical protein
VGFDRFNGHMLLLFEKIRVQNCSIAFDLSSFRNILKSFSVAFVKFDVSIVSNKCHIPLSSRA